MVPEDTIKINNQEITFKEIFNKNIEYKFSNTSYLKDKTILITGGAGSIGSVLLKHLIKQNIHKIIVLDHSEYGIFKLGLKFKEEVQNKKLHLFLGDIRNLKIIKKIFSQFSIQIIYHAAAYKHIDILENNPEESVSVNIEASINLLHTSIDYKADQFIFISTDKAVNPINIMGISKRITELNLLHQILLNKDDIKIKIVRFGNVFNSSGSVFNIFKFQLENKIPITITNKKMKRYFISKFQSANGLIQIANPKNNSGIYILSMGNSFYIEDILNSILKKSKLDYKPEIIYTNSLENFEYEKIEEELVFPYEKIEYKGMDYKNISLSNYNIHKIKLEIENLSQLLKK